MGSKARIAKHILPIILKDRQANQFFIEPFVGGCNVIDKVGGLRIGNDNNRYLIAMLLKIQQGYKFCEEIDKATYDVARQNWYDKEAGKDGRYLSDADIGWIGFMASANGRFFEGGYSGVSNTKIGTQRDYISESIRNLEKQRSLLKGIDFTHGDYYNLPMPENSIIYCDIPYKGTKQYATSKNFDYSRFYRWCREKKEQGHQLFISEYEMPEDFTCIWQMEVNSSLSANGIAGGNKVSIEKLFIP